MAILDELKLKANGAADQANNIQEAISMMEFGGGTGGVIAININNDGTLDKTWQEIHDAMAQGNLCIIGFDHGYGHAFEINIITQINSTGGKYAVVVGDYRYIASSATEYPKRDE